jgi:hypothetical protein
VWTIAQRVVGREGDPRPVVDTIIATNRIENGMIVPGQVLTIPEAG